MLAEENFDYNTYYKALVALYEKIKKKDLTRIPLHKLMLDDIGKFNILTEHIYFDLAAMYIQRTRHMQATIDRVLNII